MYEVQPNAQYIKAIKFMYFYKQNQLLSDHCVTRNS